MLGLGACDVAKPDAERGSGPDVRLVDAFPLGGCGIENHDCEVPTNGVLAFRFDRFLDPATVSRQAIRVFTGDPERSPQGILFDVTYDPIERVVEYTPSANNSFEAGALYTYELLVPDAPGEPGIRAFDGAPLAEGDLPLRGSFIVSGLPLIKLEQPVPTCADIVQHVFSDELGGCAGASCHRSFDNVAAGNPVGDAPHGLWLDSRANLKNTAIGRIARQTEVGDVSGGEPELHGARFGVRMALIDTGEAGPGASYLLYKLLRNPLNYEPCTHGSGPFCTDDSPELSSHRLLPLHRHQTLRPTQDELTRLREWFVRGEPMPLDPNNQGLSVGLGGLRAVSAFIAAGADCGQ